MTKIKICGFTRKKDIKDAIKLRVDYIGINFYPKSKRYISHENAKKILNGIKENIKIIGLFVNEKLKKIEEIVENLNLSGIQLHGDETPNFCLKLKKKFHDKIIIKAIRVKTKNDLKKINNYEEVDFFLLDSFNKNLPGGTGKLINFNLLDKSLPFKKIFIAGGITPENVKEIIRKFHPYGIDVANGVEKKPGIKDKKKIEKLVKAVKE